MRRADLGRQDGNLYSSSARPQSLKKNLDVIHGLAEIHVYIEFGHCYKILFTKICQC